MKRRSTTGPVDGYSSLRQPLQPDHPSESSGSPRSASPRASRVAVIRNPLGQSSVGDRHGTDARALTVNALDRRIAVLEERKKRVRADLSASLDRPQADMAAHREDAVPGESPESVSGPSLHAVRQAARSGSSADWNGTGNAWTGRGRPASRRDAPSRSGRDCLARLGQKPPCISIHFPHSDGTWMASLSWMRRAAPDLRP